MFELLNKQMGNRQLAIWGAFGMKILVFSLEAETIF